MQKRILIIRRGLFGDTIVAIKALKYLKKITENNSKIDYLSDSHPNSEFLTSKQVIGHLNLIDNFYNFYVKNNIKSIVLNIKLFFELFGKYDMLIILECNYSNSSLFIRKSRILGKFLLIKNILYDKVESNIRDSSSKYISTNLLDLIKFNLI